MRPIYCLVLLTLSAIALTPRPAEAAPFNVAEFRWELIVEPGLECGPSDPSCIPEDPVSHSIFSLTNIWDGPTGEGLLFDNRLVLPTGESVFFDLAPDFPFQFDQLYDAGIPAFAATSVSFLFGADLITLDARLTAPDTFAVLQFDPEAVPEPGTLGLLACGFAVLARRRRRFSDRRSRR